MRPLNALASQIRSDALGGTHATDDNPISLELVKDAIVDLRARLIEELIKNNNFDPSNFYQVLPLVLKDDPSGEKIKTGQIPALLFLKGLDPIKYFGLPNSRKPYRVIRSHHHTEGRDIRTSLVPAINLFPDGKFKVLRKAIDQREKLEGHFILSNPRDARRYNGYTDDDPFPMSSSMADAMTGKITNDYLRYYSMRNPQPNTGTMIMTPQQ